MLLWLFIYFVISLSRDNSPGCGHSPQSGPGSTQTFTFEYDGLQRIYIVHVPIQYNQNIGQPLFFSFPGYTITANFMANNFGMTSQSDEYGYIAVFLQGSRPIGVPLSWNDKSCTASPGPDGPTCDVSRVNSVNVPDNCKETPTNYCNWCNCNADDVGFVDALANYLEEVYCIDMEREYATGYSNGGMMTHRVGVDLNNRFAGIAPMHGQMHVGFNEIPKYDVPMPIFLIWGRSDRTVPGEDIMSSDFWYYLPMSNVLNTFGEFNECIVNNNPSPVSTISDGIRGFGCNAYLNGCNNLAYTYICEWNGAHVYPNQGQNNFGLRAAWDFLKDYSRIPSARHVRNMTINEYNAKYGRKNGTQIYTK